MADDSILVKIAADVGDLKSGMADAVSAIQALPDSMSSASAAASDFSSSLKTVGEVATAIFGAMTIDRAVEKLADVFKEAVFGTAEWSEELEHLSIITGASTDELQHLQGAAALLGIPLDNLATLTSQLNRRLAEMAQGGGSKAFRQALTDIGAKTGDLADINNLLLLASDYVNRVGVSSRAAGEAVAELFGRGAAQMQPFIAGLRAAEAEDRSLGASVPIAQLTQFQRAMNVLGREGVIALHELGAAIAPLGTEFAEVGIEAAAGLKTALDAMAGIGQYFANWLNIAQKALGDIFGAVVSGPASLEKLSGDWAAFQSKTVSDVHTTTAAVTKDWEDASKRINDAMAFIAKAPFPDVKGTAPGSGGPIPGIGGPGQTPSQKLAEFRAELADEEAEAGKDSDKKIEIAQAWLEKVREIQGLSTKDLIAAFAIEEKAYQSYLEENQRAALSAAANQETINKSSLAVQQAQTKAFYEQQVAAPKLRLAGGDETKLQELADQRAIAVQELAQQETLQDEEQASLMAHLNQVLAILQDSGVKDQQAIATAQANILAAQQTFEAKRIELETKAAAQLAQLDVQYTATATKQMVTLWQSAMEPIARGFDQVVSGVLQGTQSISQAFRRMGEDIALSMVRSGILGLLQGGQQGSMAGGLFGTTGAAGGLNVSSLLGGLFSSLFGGGGGGGGGASGNFFQQIISQAFTSSQPAVSSTFSAAFNSSQGVLSSLFSSIFSSLGPMLGLGGAAGGGGLMSAMSALGPLAMGGLLMFEHGGVVPSAAGGMLTPRGGAGRLAVVHPNEMILNSALTNRVTSAFPRPGEEGSKGDTHVHFNINANDTKGFDQLLKSRSGMFHKMIKDATRGR